MVFADHKQFITGEAAHYSPETNVTPLIEGFHFKYISTLVILILITSVSECRSQTHCKNKLPV